MFHTSLQDADPLIADAVAREGARQADQIELIASENIVSLAVMQLQLKSETTVEELNEHLRLESLDGEQQQQVEFSMSPDAVSSDFVGFDHAAIVDGPATIVTGSRAVIYVWYDNEWGYSRQVTRLVERVSGVRPPTFPR